jgi:hypothetical protein
MLRTQCLIYKLILTTGLHIRKHSVHSTQPYRGFQASVDCLEAFPASGKQETPGRSPLPLDPGLWAPGLERSAEP